MRRIIAPHPKARNRLLRWCLCLVGLVAIFARRTQATFCRNTTVDDSQRLIARNKHDRISFVKNTDTSSSFQEEIKVLYKRATTHQANNNNNNGRSGDSGVFEIDQVPEYFLDLDDSAVEEELEYRTQHGRWSNRVLLEKLSFTLLFGKSGFPDSSDTKPRHKGQDNNKKMTCDEKLQKEHGWDIYNRSDDICDWTGITCKQEKITELDLHLYELKGTLMEDLHYLSDLEYLDLRGNKLKGTIPTTLGQMSNLRFLGLGENLLTGSINPKCISRLKSLEKIWLSNNKLTGVLPKSLFKRLPKLTHIDFSNNRFTGPMPDGYSTDCPNLTTVYMELNQLTGKLPENVGGLKSLQVFDVGHNRMSGTIPTSWMTLPNLTDFNLAGNRFIGTIPPEIINLSNLTVLILSANQFTGTFPYAQDMDDTSSGGGWSNLSQLSIFMLNDNQLTGTIPYSFVEASATTLINFDLGSNKFTGSLPSNLGKMTNLKRFHAQHNRLTGTLPLSMSRMSPILDLNLTANFLQGTVPRIFCGSGVMTRSLLFRQFGCDAVLCPPGTFHPSGAATLESGCRPCPASDEDEDHDPPLNRVLGRLNCPGVDFVHGDLDGDGILNQNEVLRLLWVYTIGTNWGAQFQTWADPRSNACELNGIFCQDGYIVKIDLFDANMCSNGERKQGNIKDCIGIPAELSQLSHLQILQVNARKFLRATIPSEFGRLTRLQYLDFGASPYVVGTMPSEIGHLTNLKILNLAGCHLTGTIPEEFYSLTKLEKLHLSLNLFTGTISPKVARLTNLKELMWSRSQLTGSIPNEIGDATSLENLELYGNQLTGTIPSSIGKCTSLKRIDIFNNHLIGPIPESLAKLKSLQILHLKLNRLTGTIPSGFGDLPYLTWFDVSSNELHGTIPSSFGSSRSIKDFRLGGNMIYDPIPQSLCTNTNINGGLTRMYGCDGVICPLGTYSDPGHATHAEGCKACEEGATTLYLGSSSCEVLSQSDILHIFYNVMGGGWLDPIQQNHWKDPEDENVCVWNGITCDEKGEIVSIRFPLAGLNDPAMT